MAHPMIRKLAVAGALGAMALPIPGIASGLGVEPAVEPLTAEQCELLDAVALASTPECPVPEPAAELVDTAATVVTDGIDQVAGFVETLPALELPPLGGDAPAPEPAPAAPAGGDGTSSPPPVQATAPSGDSQAAAAQSTEYGAAGKDPVEVLEPAGPASDGRVETSTLDPTAVGTNIPGIHSESSLTLQPFEAPVVAPGPAVFHAPVVAPDPATATSPIKAAEVFEWAGEALVGTVAHDTGWLWALAIGVTAVGSLGLRRRYAVDLLDRL